MKRGAVVAAGTSRKDLIQRLVREVFGIEADVSLDQATGTPPVVPIWFEKHATVAALS